MLIQSTILLKSKENDKSVLITDNYFHLNNFYKGNSLMKTSINALFLTTMFLISGCSHGDNKLEGPNVIVDLKNAKDWCAGRYTLKLPAGTALSIGSDSYHSFEIKSETGASIGTFDSAHKAILQDYSSSVSTIILDGPEKKIGNKTTRIFDAKAGRIKGAPLRLHGLLLDRGVLFNIYISYDADKKDVVYSEMDRLLNNLSARSNNTIPKDKGVCIYNGFIKDDGSEFRKSSNVLAFDLNGLPSVKMSMSADAFSYAVPDLITRTKDNLADSGLGASVLSKFRTVRKGEKNQTTGDSLSGLELISTIPMKGRDGIYANWEHAGTLKSALDPAVNFTFDSGFDGNNVETSSLGEKEAIKIYESILNTIRKF